MGATKKSMAAMASRWLRREVIQRWGALRLTRASRHEARHRPLGDVEAKHPPFPVDAWGTPGRVLGRQSPDQRAKLGSDARPASATAAGEPVPVEAEAGAVPADACLGLPDHENLGPASPEAMLDDPEPEIGCCHPWPAAGPREYAELASSRYRHDGITRPPWYFFTRSPTTSTPSMTRIRTQLGRGVAGGACTAGATQLPRAAHARRPSWGVALPVERCTTRECSCQAILLDVPVARVARSGMPRGLAMLDVPTGTWPLPVERSWRGMRFPWTVRRPMHCDCVLIGSQRPPFGVAVESLGPLP